MSSEVFVIDVDWYFRGFLHLDQCSCVFEGRDVGCHSSSPESSYICIILHECLPGRKCAGQATRLPGARIANTGARLGTWSATGSLSTVNILHGHLYRAPHWSDVMALLSGRGLPSNHARYTRIACHPEPVSSASPDHTCIPLVLLCNEANPVPEISRRSRRPVIADPAVSAAHRAGTHVRLQCSRPSYQQWPAFEQRLSPRSQSNDIQIVAVVLVGTFVPHPHYPSGARHAAPPEQPAAIFGIGQYLLDGINGAE